MVSMNKIPDEIPDVVKELTHKINGLLQNSIPKGAKFACVVEIPDEHETPEAKMLSEFFNEKQLAVATNDPDGMIGLLDELMDQLESGDFESEKKPPDS